MAKIGDNYMVQPVVKALQVLDYAARQGHMMTLTEVVSEVGLPKTTVFRYLQTLSATGFLYHDIYQDRYGIGSRFRELARIDQSLNGLRQIALPEMHGLMETFKETINLGVVSDTQIVYVDVLEPKRPMRAKARVGHRNPLHSTSLGKAILAYLPEADRLLEQDPALPQITINTLTDVSALRRQTNAIRQRGYALEKGENEDGLMCIGVPILNRSGYPVAAMSLSAPERRMPPELTTVAAGALMDAAVRISRQLCEAV